MNYYVQVAAADLSLTAGMFLRPGFLQAKQCEGLCEELAAGEACSARVVFGGKESSRAERRSKRAEGSTDSIELISGGLLALKPELEEHFQTKLDTFEKPQFLLYEEGDYFGYHFDGLADATGPAYLRRRIISIVLFLNRQSAVERAKEFAGGLLTLYGLEGDQEARSVKPETGLLVAFPSRTYHKVEPVTRGKRFTAVSWYSAR